MLFLFQTIPAVVNRYNIGYHVKTIDKYWWRIIPMGLYTYTSYNLPCNKPYNIINIQAKHSHVLNLCVVYDDLIKENISILTGIDKKCIFISITLNVFI